MSESITGISDGGNPTVAVGGGLPVPFVSESLPRALIFLSAAPLTYHLSRRAGDRSLTFGFSSVTRPNHRDDETEVAT